MFKSKFPTWFGGGPAVDDHIKQEFGKDLANMAAGANESWKDKPWSCLAGIVLMDQFSRNSFRGSPQAFALDPKALAWSQHLLVRQQQAFSRLCYGAGTSHVAPLCIGRREMRS